MPQPFRAVLVKGRSNYLSLRRFAAPSSGPAALLAEPVAASSCSRSADGRGQTHDGSRSDLRFQPLPAVWDLVESDSGNCLGRGCPDYAKCFYFKARKQMFGANC